MIKHAVFLVAVSTVGCDQGVPKHAKTTSTVTLTSVAFADDCGGTPPTTAPVPATPPAKIAPPAAQSQVAGEVAAQDMARRRRCEQTSMQLAIASKAATELHIKSVEVFDPEGTSLGTLSASKPTRWDDAKASYEAWDEKVGTGATSVSYVLSQPVFVDPYDARDRTYTVKVVAALGGVDQPLKTTVLVVGRPPPVPT